MTLGVGSRGHIRLSGGEEVMVSREVRTILPDSLLHLMRQQCNIASVGGQEGTINSSL